MRVRSGRTAGSGRPTKATCALVAFGAVVAPLLLAGGSLADGSARIASTGATALVRSAVRDATARGSVHVSESVRSATRVATFSNDVAASDGAQTIHLSGAVGEAQVALLGVTAYFTASPQVLAEYFGFPAAVASTIHGRWISVPSTSTAYAAIADGVTMSSTLRELIPEASLKLTGSSSVNGVAVIGIRGTIKASASSPAGTATVYVSRSAAPLPVKVDFRDTRGDTVTAAFTQWGERVTVKAPAAGAISIASLAESAADIAAQELAHSAQVAAETYATDHNGSYAGLTPAVLHSYEATIQIAPGNGNAYVSAATGNRVGYTVTATSASGDTFSIIRTNGAITRVCTPPSGVNGGCQSGHW